jgi:precorrin-3B C17-methyltransferase
MKVSIVGIGPGGGTALTGQARQVLTDCDLIVGYTVYIDLLRGEFGHKDLRSTAMRRETDRCRMAIEEALRHQHVALVCSGDPGVYGLAGLVYEIAQEYDPIEIEVVPGITAACSGAAILGAPLIHDFAIISLSDLLTPWEKIEKRLSLAAQGDFVICLYNPASKKRRDYLKKACDALLLYKSATTICGLVRQIGRDGQAGQILTLSELREAQVDMFTTVYIGNEQTRVINGKMITPRGYRLS